MAEQTEIDLHKQLKETWDQTPLTLVVSREKFLLLSQENRYLILRALNIGIHEPDYVRHILTAQEILEYMQKNHNEEIKLTNVYFHLQKLQENDFIKEVAQTGTGKRPKTYYGRTAKIFISTDSMSEDLDTDEFYQKLFEIIKAMRPDLSREEITKPFYELYSLKYEKEAKIIENWFKENKDIIDKVDIEPNRLYMFLAKLLDYHNDYISLNNKVADILKLNIKSDD